MGGHRVPQTSLLFTQRAYPSPKLDSAGFFGRPEAPMRSGGALGQQSLVECKRSSQASTLSWPHRALSVTGGPFGLELHCGAGQNATCEALLESSMPRGGTGAHEAS
eukprot:1471693-Alexandrium_andersonii.AAC.1